MEHVGRHVRKEARSDTLDLKTWRMDGELETYLLREGLIIRGQNGDWKIGDGAPLWGKEPGGNGPDEYSEGTAFCPITNLMYGSCIVIPFLSASHSFACRPSFIAQYDAAVCILI